MNAFEETETQLLNEFVLDEVDQKIQARIAERRELILVSLASQTDGRTHG